jgi:hypothetical protein
MHKQQRPWKLPENVKFYIVPRHVLIVEGVPVLLTQAQAEILLLLMSNAGRRYMAHEIMEEVYAHREDGDTINSNAIAVQIWNMRKRCAESGVELPLKASNNAQGYVFSTVSLNAKGRKKAKKVAASILSGVAALPKARTRGAAKMAGTVRKIRGKRKPYGTSSSHLAASCNGNSIRPPPPSSR